MQSTARQSALKVLFILMLALYGAVAIGQENSGPVVINSFTGPSELDVKEEGTWTIDAASHHDDDGTFDLSYKVDWGENKNVVAWTYDKVKSWFGQHGFVQQSKLSHSYAKAGTYTITATVKNKDGETAKKTVQVAVGKVATSTPAGTGFFSRVANAFQNMFQKTVGFFFPGFKNRITDREFSNLPEGTGEYTSGTRGLSDIEAIIINKAAKVAGCKEGGDYQAYVILKDSEIALKGCARYNVPYELLDYLASIALDLKGNYGFETLDPNKLAKLPIYFGNAEDDLDDLLSSDDGEAEDPNKVGIEVKVKDQNGNTVKDWQRANVTILATDQLFFRWNAEEYYQCLPFLADNGTYAFTRSDTRSMTTGNTEAENYNVTERTGNYSIECARSNNDNVRVDRGIIHVTLGQTRTSEALAVTLTPQSGIDYGTSVKLTWPKVGITTEQGMYLVLRDEKGQAIASKIVPTPTSGTMTFQIPSPEQFCNDFFSDALGQCGNYAENGGKFFIELVTYTPKNACLGFCALGTPQKQVHQVIRSVDFTIGNYQQGPLRATPQSGPAPLDVSFTASTSQTFFGGTKLDFGDGSEKVTCNPPANSGTCTATHKYQKDGTYTARYLGIGEGSPAETVIGKVNIDVGNTPNKFKGTPTAGKAPLKVNFSFPENINATLSFGDGSPSKDFAATTTCSGAASASSSCTVKLKKVAHTYTKAGTYTARLISGCPINAGTCNQSAKVETVKITVTNPPPPPPPPTPPAPPTPPKQPTYNPCNNVNSSADYDACKSWQGGGGGYDGYGTYDYTGTQYSPTNQSPNAYNPTSGGSGNPNRGSWNGSIFSGVANGIGNAVTGLPGVVNSIWGAITGNTNTNSGQGSGWNSDGSWGGSGTGPGTPN